MSQELLTQDLLHEEEINPAQALSLKEIFGGKFIEFGSMDRLIRWVTGLGIAQIIVAVLLIGLNLADLPSVSVHRPDGSVSFTVAWPILIACAGFMVLAWTWLVVGALHSRAALRVPLLLLFLGLHAGLVYVHGQSLVGWVLLAMWAGYVIWHGISRPAGYGRDLLVMGLGLAYFYLALSDQYMLLNANGEFVTTLLSGQIMVMSLLLMPLFVFAGLDLGESVRDVTRWLIGQGAARTGDRVLFWTALALCAGKAALLVALDGAGADWLMAIPFLLAAGYVCVRMRPWEGLGHEPQAGLLLTGTVVKVMLLFGLVVLQMVLNFTFDSSALMLWAIGTIGALATAGAVIAGSRKGSAGARTAATYLMLLAFWTAVMVVTSPRIWHDVFGLPALAQVHLRGLDGGVVVLLPVLLLVLWRQGLVTKSVSAWAISLTVGLSVVRGMYWLVEHNFDVPAMTAAGQLFIMAMGLLWDVLTSGDRWTNGDSPRVPRTARVLLYFGYVAMSVTALLYWKGSGQSGTFDEDTQALTGLIVLGVPLYLYGFARAGALLVHQAWRRQRQAI